MFRAVMLTLCLLSWTFAAEIPKTAKEHSLVRVGLDDNESVVVLFNSKITGKMEPVETDAIPIGVVFTGAPGDYLVLVTRVTMADGKPIVHTNADAITIESAVSPKPSPVPNPDPSPQPVPPSPVPADLDNTLGIGSPVFLASKQCADREQLKTVMSKLVALYSSLHKGQMLPDTAKQRLLEACVSEELKKWHVAFDAAITASQVHHGAGINKVRDMYREAAMAVEASLR